MNSKELVETLARDLAALPERSTTPMRQVRKRYSRLLRSEPAEFIFQMADVWLSSGGDRWIAYEIVAGHPAAYQALDRRRLEALGRGIDSWWTVDAFGRTLSGPAWRDGLISPEPIRDWARSEDLWWRRAALVSTVALNLRSQGGQGDVPNTLAICQILAGDGEDMVVKALSWALRHLIVHDADAVKQFLRENDSSLHARVKREVNNKLRTGLKNP